MGDLKSPWDEQGKNGADVPDLAGNGVTARGGDPNVDTSGAGGLKDFWPADKQLLANGPDGKETPNSVSGLPTLPSRFEPTEQPPTPPDLTDRRPGTIDKQ